MQRILFPLLLIACYSASAQQKLVSDTSFVIMSYNVENLFDTINDPDKDDEEFLPDGKNKWTTQRYTKKLQQLSKVISFPNEKNLPAVIGLIEIENKKVVEDLAATEKLKSGNYGIIHYESPYLRGIDVAMMYRKDLITILYSKAIPILLTEGPETTTRDILFVKALSGATDTLYFFINHWPSRRNGAETTENSRIKAAAVLRSSVDSVFRFYPDSKIIIMGDFNDYPDNKSVCETLGADSLADNPRGWTLLNLCYMQDKKGEGTYKYKDDWGMLDQFIVSYAVLKGSDLHTDINGTNILKPKWMLYFNKKTNESKPNSTYGGPIYYGGYSDHLPIYMELHK